MKAGRHTRPCLFVEECMLVEECVWCVHGVARSVAAFFVPLGLLAECGCRFNSRHLFVICAVLQAAISFHKKAKDAPRQRKVTSEIWRGAQNGHLPETPFPRFCPVVRSLQGRQTHAMEMHTERRGNYKKYSNDKKAI